MWTGSTERKIPLSLEVGSFGGGADTLGRGDLSSHSFVYFVLRTVRSECSDETNEIATQGMMGRLDLAPIVGFETFLPS